MSAAVRFETLFCLFLGLLTFAGCSSPPVLISKNAATPVGVDLSGNWLIRNEPGAAVLARRGGDAEPIILSDRSQRRRSNGRRKGVSAQVFLEYGESLKITQTDFGLFISYDRSVVEEYRFGENRLVTIGPIEAKRVSGWDGNSFVVETLDKQGLTLFESWQLEDNNTVLSRNIRLQKGDIETFSARQIFDRS